MLFSPLAFLLLVLNHTLFSSLGLYIIRNYWDYAGARKFFFLSIVEVGIPLGIYLALRSLNPELGKLAFSSIFFYLALFIALTRITFPEFHTGEIFVMIGINAIGMSLLGLLDSLGRFFLYFYLVILIGMSVFFLAENVFKNKRLKKLKESLPNWETYRKKWIENQLYSRREFHTFCFECCHFDSDQRICAVELITGSITKISFPDKGREEYCLYWNVTSHPNIKKSPNFKHFSINRHYR